MKLLKSDAFRMLLSTLAFFIYGGIFIIIIPVFFAYICDAYWKDLYMDNCSVIVISSFFLSMFLTAATCFTLEDIAVNI